MLHSAPRPVLHPAGHAEVSCHSHADADACRLDGIAKVLRMPHVCRFILVLMEHHHNITWSALAAFSPPPLPPTLRLDHQPHPDPPPLARIPRHHGGHG